MLLKGRSIRTPQERIFRISDMTGKGL